MSISASSGITICVCFVYGMPSCMMHIFLLLNYNLVSCANSSYINRAFPIFVLYVYIVYINGW